MASEGGARRPAGENDLGASRSIGAVGSSYEGVDGGSMTNRTRMTTAMGAAFWGTASQLVVHRNRGASCDGASDNRWRTRERVGTNTTAANRATSTARLRAGCDFGVMTLNISSGRVRFRR